MSLGGELLSLAVSLAQEIGIVAGVGALTITLIGHLLSLHARQNETVYGYVRAARHIRALALALVILSGGAATLIHFQAGTPEILFAPAYMFKWLLIALLAAFYFTELKVDGIGRDAVEGFEGANWYALFIVHSIAPVAGWGALFAIYFGWLATFAVVWAGFVLVMRGRSTRARNPMPSKPAPKPVPPPAPKPAPMPPAQKPIEVHPTHTLLPMVAELDLPAPISRVPAPKPMPPLVPPKPPAPSPVPHPPQKVEIVPESSRPPVPMSNLEEQGLPALHVMPKRPEDIGSSKRGPVVKVSSE